MNKCSYIFLIFSVVLCSYGMAVVSVASPENFFFNLALAITIILFVALKFVRNIMFEKKILWFLPLSLFPLFVTFRMNLISLFLMLSLILIRKNLFNANGRRVFLWLAGVFFSIILLAHFFCGFNEKFSQDIWNPRNEEFTYRMALGFTHPNQAMLKYFGFVLVLLVGVTRKNVFRKSVFVLFTIIPLYFLTLSRTVVIAVIFTLFLLILYRKKMEKQVPLFFKSFVSFFPLIFFVLSLIAMNFCNNNFLNLLFSGRLGFYKAAVDSYGFTLFGTAIIEKGNDLIIDSSYFNTILSKGIVFFLVYVSLFRYAVKKTVLTYRKSILLTAFFACAFTETMFFKFDLMFALLLIVFYEPKKAPVYEKNFNLSGAKII